MADQEPVEKGEIIPIEFGGKIIAAKRRCSCGGDVVFEPNPDGAGKIARCTRCGAELAFGGS
ncbi:MAG: hypothetical protein P8X64_10810 [Anaerolineales bacterium]|jgi:hypothetical protein